MKAMLEHVITGNSLSRHAAREAFSRIMVGEVEPVMLGAFLTALAAKGETAEEIVGAAEAMRAAAKPVHADQPCVDTCGTGGDGISTFNVSTTAALIAAACGAVVAKHGNRTNTRVSGSAEVLQALGVNIDADVPTLERCLRGTGIAFLYARNLHPAMKHAAPVRQALGIRTIFNLLGPLTNPAGATRQVLGVSRPEHLELIGQALLRLGAERAWVVHGHDGLCDLTITGPTRVVEVAGGKLQRRTVVPEDAGLTRGSLADLLVKTPAESATVVRAILDGQLGPRRDHALLNAAATLVVYGITDDLQEATQRSAQALDNGQAARKLEELVLASNNK